MDPKHKEMLDKLTKEVNENNNLSAEEKKLKLQAIEIAVKAVSDISDFKGDYSHLKDTENIQKSQEETKNHIREEFNNIIKREGQLQGKRYDNFYVEKGEPKFTIDGNLAEAKKNIIDRYEFSPSEGFKSKILKIVDKLNEYGINDPKYGGETGTKIYSLYKYKELKDEYKKAVNDGDLDKIVELKPKYDETMAHYKELLDMTIELSKTEVVDNLDCERETMFPPELWNREIAVSNLNSIFEGLTYCKNHNIDYKEYINNPFKYFKNNFDAIWKDYKEENYLPRDVKLSTRLAKIIDIQTSDDRGGELHNQISYQSSFASRAIELFQKLDKGPGLEGRSLYSAYAANASSIYENTPFFSNYLNLRGVEGLKNVFLIGDTVDNIAELDSSYIDPDTLEMNKYPYKNSLQTAELSNDFVEKTVRTAIDTFYEIKAMQEEADGYCGTTLDGHKLLYTVTSLFNDILTERDLTNNPKLAKKMMEFCKDPTKHFSDIGKKMGHNDLDTVSLLNEVYEKGSHNTKIVLPNPKFAKDAEGMIREIGDRLDGNVLDMKNFERVFAQLKVMKIEQKYNKKPSILHPFNRRKWNRNNQAMLALKETIYTKLGDFGINAETLDSMLNNPNHAQELIRGMEKYSLINSGKIKAAYDKAFDKGDLDDLTPEQMEAYAKNIGGPELEEAQKIISGNSINEKNLTVAVDLLKQLNKAGSTSDINSVTEYIYQDLRDKGLDDETLRKTVEGKVEISSYINEFNSDKKVVYDLDEEFVKKLHIEVNEVGPIDLDEPEEDVKNKEAENDGPKQPDGKNYIHF